MARALLWLCLCVGLLCAQPSASALSGGARRQPIRRPARAVAVPRTTRLEGDYGADTPSAANCTEHWFTQRVSSPLPLSLSLSLCVNCLLSFVFSCLWWREWI